jgi:hypothetical protein
MTKPAISEFEINDGVNELVSISIDRDADPGVRSYVLDQQGAGDYLYLTLEGLRALVEAAEQLEVVK